MGAGEVFDEEDLAVPLGISTSGSPVRPSKAVKGERYACPECRDTLVFRHGAIRQAHFAHRGDSKCSAESRLHKSGKLLVAYVVREWVTARAAKPVITYTHEDCEKEERHELPDTITDTRLEYRIKSGRILDVALLSGEDVVLGVEIYVTHRVDAAKKSEVPYPWIELDAKDLLDEPRDWVCRQQSLASRPCAECAAREAERRDKESALADLHRPTPPRWVPPPVIPWGVLHATTVMPIEKIEMNMGRMGEVLDAVGDIPAGSALPGGGILQDPAEWISELRAGLESFKNLEEYRKRAFLWRLSEFLGLGHAHPAGVSPDEVARNLGTIGDALTWLKGK